MQNSNSDTELDVDVLIKAIREAVVEQEMLVNPLQQGLFDATSAENLPADFLNHLFTANRLNNSLQPDIQLLKPKVPVIGGLINWLRRQFHQLVVFYVSNAVERQHKINTHLLKAAYLLGQYHALTQQPHSTDE